MRPHVRASFMTMLALPALSSAGCSTAIRQGLAELRGANATMHVLQTAGGAQMARIGSVRFEQASSSLGPTMFPQSYVALFNQSARGAEEELSHSLPGADPVLQVACEVNYFQKKGLLSGALMVTRVMMRSAGQMLTDAVILTESKSFRAGDEEALIDKTVETIADYIRKQAGIEKAEGDSESRD